MLQDFKEQFATSKQPWGFGYIVNYPQTPAELPDNIREHAYSADDGPASEYLDRLRNVVLNHIPLRRNSKLLERERRGNDASSLEMHGLPPEPRGAIKANAHPAGQAA